MLRAQPQMQFVQMSLFKKKSSIKRSHLERWLNVIADVIPSSIWNNSLLAHCLVFGNDTFSQVATFSGVVVRFWYWSNMQYSENLYRMSETTFDISVFDPFWQFPLPNVVLYATHQENKRLFGFVLRTSGGRADSRQTSICYIFESNNEGEKVLVMVIFVSIFIFWFQLFSDMDSTALVPFRLSTGFVWESLCTENKLTNSLSNCKML